MTCRQNEGGTLAGSRRHLRSGVFPKVHRPILLSDVYFEFYSIYVCLSLLIFWRPLSIKKEKITTGKSGGKFGVSIDQIDFDSIANFKGVKLTTLSEAFF